MEGGACYLDLMGLRVPALVRVGKGTTWCQSAAYVMFARSRVPDSAKALT